LQFNAPDRISIDETKEVTATLTLLDRAAAPGIVDVPSCTIGARLTGIDFAIRDEAETRRTRTIDVDDGKTGRKRVFDVVADPVKNNAAIVVATVAGSVLAAIAVARLKK
jgi:hypothetical protein